MTGAAINRCHRAPWILYIGIYFCQNFSRSGLTSMTFHTPSHSQRLLLLNSSHSFYISMASLTRNSFCNMSLMREVNIIWKLMNANPFNGLLFLIGFSDLLNIGAVDLDNRVTVHTNIHGRNTCVS